MTEAELADQNYKQAKELLAAVERLAEWDYWARDVALICGYSESRIPYMSPEELRGNIKAAVVELRKGYRG